MRQIITTMAKKKKTVDLNDKDLHDYLDKVFQKAKTNYKVERTVNIACYSSAALLYVVHLCRSISLGSKYKSGNLTFAPAVMNTGNEMAFGMNINLTF